MRDRMIVLLAAVCGAVLVAALVAHVAQATSQAMPAWCGDDVVVMHAGVADLRARLASPRALSGTWVGTGTLVADAQRTVRDCGATSTDAAQARAIVRAVQAYDRGDTRGAALLSQS